MKRALSVGLLLVCVGTAGIMAPSAVGRSGSVHAEGTETWEYGYLVNVVSVESHEINLKSWAASRGDRDYLSAHVFVYERGLSDNDLTLNKLKRMNELAEEGWELYDEPSGLLRRRR